MDVTFETIGLEVPSEKAFNTLAERAGDQGEPTQLSRRGAVLHGRCWKLGEGLEVWTVLYESGTGDIFYAVFALATRNASAPGRSPNMMKRAKLLFMAIAMEQTRKFSSSCRI
jgi:hypothetical protein